MTSVSLVESSPQGGNPIDLVEEIVIANDWSHDRASEEELPPRDRLRLELTLETALAAVLGRDVDVRIINKAPLAVRGKAVQTGILLYSRDDTTRVDFETAVRSAYFDFLPVLEYHRAAYFASQRADLTQRGIQ